MHARDNDRAWAEKYEFCAEKNLSHYDRQISFSKSRTIH